jgi:hypothetical protein
MTKTSGQRLPSVVAALICALQLADVPDVWAAGRPFAASLVSLAAVIGAAMGIWSFVRPGPATVTGNAWLYGATWNHRINAAFFCYFLATLTVSRAKPGGLRSLIGIVGILGLVATILFAVRALRARRRAA